MQRISFPTFLWICFTVFIVYATTIPFNVVRSMSELLHNIHIISWIPFYNTDCQEYFSLANIITNIMFFIPFGLFGFYSFQSKNKMPVLRIFITVWLCGVVTSAFVEFLQMFTIDRNTSTTDLITNSGGAVIGALIAFKVEASTIQAFYAKHMSRYVRARTFFPFVCIGLLTVVSSTAPFDFILSRGRVLKEVGNLKMGVLHNVDIKELFNATYFATLLSCTAALCFREWKLRCFSVLAMGTSLFCGVFVLMAQLFIGSRHVVMGTCIGFAAGSIMGIVLQAMVTIRRMQWAAWPLYFVTIFVLVAVNLTGHIAQESTLGNLLAQKSTMKSGLESLSNFIQITCLFVPIGFLLAYRDSRLRKVNRLLMTLFIVPVLAMPVILFLSHGVSLKHFAGVISLAESGVVIGVIACVWGQKVISYYAKDIDAFVP